MVDPADKPSAMLRVVGVPSAESHIGGEDAVGERTVDGMQVWSGISGGIEGTGLFGALSSFPFVAGRRVLDGWSCQKWSSDGESKGLGGGLRYLRRAGDGSSSDGGGRLSSVSSGAKENTDRVRKSSGGMIGFAAIEDTV
jgi:hypothetical protein